MYRVRALSHATGCRWPLGTRKGIATEREVAWMRRYMQPTRAGRPFVRWFEAPYSKLQGILSFMELSDYISLANHEAGFGECLPVRIRTQTGARHVQGGSCKLTISRIRTATTTPSCDENGVGGRKQGETGARTYYLEKDTLYEREPGPALRDRKDPSNWPI